MTANPILNYTVAVGDSDKPTNTITVEDDGSINVNGISVTIAGVTVANGADVAEGNITDTAVTLPTGNATVIGLLKGRNKLSSRTYNTVAASQTAQVLTGGGGGASGDFLDHLLVVPATVAAGNISILDGNTSIQVFATGTLADLKPFPLLIQAVSASGAWKVTTGGNVSVVATGQFT